MKRLLNYQATGPDGEPISLWLRVFYNVALPLLLVALLVSLPFIN